MRIMGSFRAQGVNLFPWEFLQLQPRSVGSRDGWVGYEVSRLHRVVLLDPKSQSLSNIAHVQGKELPDTAVINILILDLCKVFCLAK